MTIKHLRTGVIHTISPKTWGILRAAGRTEQYEIVHNDTPETPAKSKRTKKPKGDKAE